MAAGSTTATMADVMKVVVASSRRHLGGRCAQAIRKARAAILFLSPWTAIAVTAGGRKWRLRGTAEQCIKE